MQILRQPLKQLEIGTAFGPVPPGCGNFRDSETAAPRFHDQFYAEHKTVPAFNRHLLQKRFAVQLEAVGRIMSRKPDGRQSQPRHSGQEPLDGRPAVLPPAFHIAGSADDIRTFLLRFFHHVVHDSGRIGEVRHRNDHEFRIRGFHAAPDRIQNAASVPVFQADDIPEQSGIRPVKRRKRGIPVKIVYDQNPVSGPDPVPDCLKGFTDVRALVVYRNDDREFPLCVHGSDTPDADLFRNPRDQFI